MVWVAPATFVANTALTAAQLNTFIRDNLLETEAAKATTAGRLFWTTSRNAIAERPLSESFVSTTETTASTSFVDLGTSGPSVTLFTGRYALVAISAAIRNGSETSLAHINYYVSGATEQSHQEQSELKLGGNAAGTTHPSRSMTVSWCTNLNPGVNTFTLQYKVSADDGVFFYRRLTVIAL